MNFYTDVRSSLQVCVFRSVINFIYVQYISLSDKFAYAIFVVCVADLDPGGSGSGQIRVFSSIRIRISTLPGSRSGFHIPDPDPGNAVPSNWVITACWGNSGLLG